MKINVFLICVGKIRENYLKEGIEEYQKRLSRFCRLKIVEADEMPIPEICRDNDRKKILRLEAEGITKKIPPHAEIVSLDVHGKIASSEEFSGWLAAFSSRASVPLVFIIGGSMGLDEVLIKQSSQRISLSAMTFPHSLVRLIFLEQLYRSFKIMHGEKYHK